MTYLCAKGTSADSYRSAYYCRNVDRGLQLHLRKLSSLSSSHGARWSTEFRPCVSRVSMQLLAAH